MGRSPLGTRGIIGRLLSEPGRAPRPPLGLVLWDLWPCQTRPLPDILEVMTRGERIAMSVTEFFRYLLGHEPSTGFAVQLLEACSARVEVGPVPTRHLP